MGFERNKKIIIKVLILIIVLLVALAGYIVLVNNPNFKIKAAVKYIFNEVDSAIDLSQNSAIANAFLENKTEITNRLTAKLSLSDDIITQIGPVGKNIEDLINASAIETNIKSDVPNKYSDIAMSYSYNNERITANAYIDKSQLYVLIKDYLDKYIKIEEQQSAQKIMSTVSAQEIRYLLDISKKSIVDAVSYGQITTSKVEIDIDEEKIPVNKTTLTIDKKFTNQVTTILLNKILMDDKAKEIILKLVDSEVCPNIAALEDDIRDQLLNIESTTYDNEVLAEYSLYTSGIFNNIVRNEVKAFAYDNTVLQYTTYKTEKFDTQISIYSNNELMSQINIKETSENNYDTSATLGQDMSMDVKGIISDSKVDVNYTVRISGMDDLKGDLNIETRNISKNEINQTFTIRLDTPESYGTANLTVESTLKIIDSITKPDFTNSVKLESLTTKQLMDIYMNFQSKNPEFVKVIDKIINQ